MAQKIVPMDRLTGLGDELMSDNFCQLKIRSCT